MTPDDRRWNELQTRWAAGEELDPAQAAERLAQAEQSPLAERELEVFTELKAALAPAAAFPAPAGLVSRVLERLEERRHPVLRLLAQPSRPRPGWSRKIGISAALAAAAVAASAVLVLGRHPARPTVPRAPAVALPAVTSPSRSELVFASGEVKLAERRVEVGQGTLSAGQRVSTGRGHACLTIEPAIDLCLGEHTEIVLDSLATDDIRVRVEAGGAVASLAPRTPEHRFALVTSGLSAEAHGTVFALERRDAVTSVSVVEGRVEVASGPSSSILVAAHSRLRLGARPETIGRAEESRLWSLLGPRDLWQRGALGVLEVIGRDDATQVWIEQKGPFGLPLHTFVPAGRHRLVVRDVSGREKSLEVEIVAAATRVIDTSVGQAPTPSPALSSAPQSAPALLADARREMSRGHPRAALTLYRQLRAGYPTSPEAATVLVTMGKLELGQGSPAQALTDFEAYLKSGGPLAPEAMAGKIRALRALGRSADEQAAIEQYLARYPNGFEARAFEQRLKVLRDG